jgi:hypothetical protein
MAKPSLENCGKYLRSRGKLVRISGLNIVNLTYFSLDNNRQTREDKR